MKHGRWLAALLATASAGCGSGEREPDPLGNEETGAAAQAILGGENSIPKGHGINTVRIIVDPWAKIDCTGTILTPRWVLTAKHCQVGPGRDVHHEPTDEHREVERQVDHPTRDLALLELRQSFGINAPDVLWQKVHVVDPLGWPVFTRVVTWGYGRTNEAGVGHANFREWSFTRGTDADNVFYFYNKASEASAQSQKGDSGGGAFLLEDVNGIQASTLVGVSRSYATSPSYVYNEFEAITLDAGKWIANTIDPGATGAVSYLSASLDVVGTADDASPGAPVPVEVQCHSINGVVPCGTATGIANGPGNSFRVRMPVPEDGQWHPLKVIARNVGPLGTGNDRDRELPTGNLSACRRPGNFLCDGELLRKPNGQHFVMVGYARIPLAGPTEAGALGYVADNFHLDETGVVDALRTIPIDGTVLQDGQTPGNPTYVIVFGAKLKIVDPKQFRELDVDPLNAYRVPAAALAQIPDTPQGFPSGTRYGRDGAQITAEHPGGQTCTWIMVGGARLLSPGSPPSCLVAPQGVAPTGIASITGAAAETPPAYTMPSSFVDAIPTAPRDGYFLRENGSSLLHHTYGGGKLPIPTPEVLQALGHPPQPTVYVVADGALAHLPNRTFYGKLDFVHRWGEVHGWAVDMSSPTAAAFVDIYMDARPGEPGSIKLGRVAANNVDRTDINGFLNVTGVHGFRFVVPNQYRDGKFHYVYAYGVDPAIPAPGVMALQLAYNERFDRLISNFDGVDRAGHVRGWAFDFGAPAQLPKLQFSARRKTSGGSYVDCASGVTITPTVPRPDVNARFNVSGVLGFDYTIPDSCRDGGAWEFSLYATVPSVPALTSYLAIDRPVPQPGPDRMLSGDFLGRGRKQLLFANGDGRGGQLRVMDYGTGEPFGKSERMDVWSTDQAHSEFFDAEDQWLTGDFLGVGHDQLLLSNRPPEGKNDGKRLRILDLYNAAPSSVAYEESWEEPLPAGSADSQNADIALSGDFLQRGYDQVLFVNHDDSGGDSRYVVYDYKQKRAGGTLLAGSGWIDSDWTSRDDRWVVGDFLHRGHDQILFTNRQPGGAGRVAVYDPLSRTNDYLEPWGTSALLDGWMDEDDLLLSGDFFGLGYDQAMYVNRGGGGGKVLVLDYASRVVPGQGKLWLDWSSSHLNGFLDREETWVVGDFRSRGCAAIAHLDYSGRGGKLAMSEYKWGPSYIYWQDWGASVLLDGWTDPPRVTPSVVAPIAARAGSGQLGAPLAPSAPLPSGWTSQDFADGFVYAHPSWSPFVVRGVFRDQYAAMGRENSFLKYPFGEETWTADLRGRTLAFQGGAIYWRPDLGPVPVSTEIRSRWLSSFGGETGFLGYPVARGLSKDGGEHTHFEHGTILSKPGFQMPGTHEIHGTIRDRYSALGWEWSVLGYPKTDELPLGDGVGRYNDFEGGSIYWHPSFGASPLVSAIRQLWLQQGGTSGWMGYPTAGDPTATSGGYYALFQNGCIYWHPSTGAHFLSSMRNKFFQLGAEMGRLGFIKSDEAPLAGAPNARVAEFQGGTLWVPAHLPVAFALFSGPVRDRYLQLGGPQSSGLGYPEADEVIDPVTGRREGRFQLGTIVYQPGVGTTVTYTPPPPDPDPDPGEVLCHNKPWMCDP